MRKLNTVFVLVLVFMFGLAVFAHAEAISITLEPGGYDITQDADGFDTIEIDGYKVRGAPGNPMLPSKVFNILVPPDIVWDSLQLTISDTESVTLAGPYEIRPAAPDAAYVDGKMVYDWGESVNVVDGKNMDVYGKDAFFPLECVKLLPYSQLRKWKYTKVAFSPVQYNPVTGKVKSFENIKIEISFQRSGEQVSPALLKDKVMDHLAPGLFYNYETAKDWYNLPEGADQSSNGSYYVIITTNAIQSNSTKLASFISHKQARGHSVLVVTETDFNGLKGQTPNHRAEKIRQWLINNYSTYGIEHVLLIGDPHPYESGEGDIPMKMCWPRRGEGSNEESPTDAFYADLNGNWDLDGDQYYGEWSDYTGSGGVDFAMEVWVGRIPVYSAAYSTLDNILQKIMDYENETNISWRDSTLLPMSFSAPGPPTYDGAPLAEQMKDDYLVPRSYSYWRQYQQGSGACGLNSIYPSEEELRGGTVVRDRWAANDYGVVCWWGHGSDTSAAVGYDGCWDGTLFDNSQTSSLDDDHPSFTYQCSCTNAYPENSSNLAYSILIRGGIGTVSATRVSWFNTDVGYGAFDGSSTNSGIGYEYVNRLTQPLAAGRALYEGKLAVVPDIGTRTSRLMNQYDFNLYGDPSVGLDSSASPDSPEITSPTPGSTLSCYSETFQWTDNGTPVTEWWLYLGSSQGANDYYDSSSLGTSTSHTVTRCWPDDSSTVWARLWYKTEGSWESVDSSYTAPTNCPGPSPPEITSPTPGSTLSCDSETFQWTDNGTPVTEWWLYLGSSQGAYNYYNSDSLGTSTSHTVTRCWPDDSSTVWARLWYKTGGSWESEDFQYIAPTNCPGPSPPEITGPTPGSTLSCNSDTFQWTDNGTPVTEWWLYLGSSQGAYNYYNSGSLGTSTSHTVTRCWPDDASTVWARLWYKTGGSWESEDFQYIAPTNCPGPSPPEITSPAQGSTLSCNSDTFQWTDNGTPVTEWWLYLGSSQGAYNYYNSGSLGTSTSHTVTRCWPDDASTIWARLWYKTGGSWESEDFQYIAPTGCTAGGFNSQFNGDASGWEVHYGTWWIASNQWYTTDGDPTYWASVSYADDFANFDYQARLWRNGSDSNANVVLIRGTPTPLSSVKDWNSSYAFQYTRNGYYSVWKGVAGGTGTSLQDWTYSSAINQGNAWNTLRVVANGTSLYFYINGTLVWSGSDSSLSSGRVGIEMYSDGTSGDQLWVDWATLTEGAFTITDKVSEEQKALNEEANERGGGSKETSSSLH